MLHGAKIAPSIQGPPGSEPLEDLRTSRRDISAAAREKPCAAESLREHRAVELHLVGAAEPQHAFIVIVTVITIVIVIIIVIHNNSKSKSKS